MIPTYYCHAFFLWVLVYSNWISSCTIFFEARVLLLLMLVCEGCLALDFGMTAFWDLFQIFVLKYHQFLFWNWLLYIHLQPWYKRKWQVSQLDWHLSVSKPLMWLLIGSNYHPGNVKRVQKTVSKPLMWLLTGSNWTSRSCWKCQKGCPSYFDVVTASCRKGWNIHTLYQYTVFECMSKGLKDCPLINNITSNSKYFNLFKIQQNSI